MAARSAAEVVERVVENLERSVRAPRATLELCVLCVIAEGHLIIEDFPGVGKTVLAKSVARSLDLSFSRLQFTPDLLPTDVTGVNVFNQRSGEFEFRPGPVFANVLLVDEINRASPKTQSALLEAMQEAQVTIDGMTYELEQPFFVVATQNPIEYEGTYPLPEAQLDRFTASLSLGYPPHGEEARMLAEQTTNPPLDQLLRSRIATTSSARSTLHAPSSSRRAWGTTSSRSSGTPATARCSLSEQALERASRSCAWRRRARGAPTRLRRARGRPERGACGAFAPCDRGSGGACGGGSRRGRDRAGARRGGNSSMSAWRGGLGLGAIALGAAIASGSRPLGVVGVGFLLAWGLTWLWTWLAERPVALSLEVRPENAREGDRVSLAIEVRRMSRVPLGSVSLDFALGRLGRRTERLRGHGRLLTARVDLGSLPRGVYVIDDAQVVVGDLLGLASLTPPVAFEKTTLVVRPRLVALDGLFCDAGVVGGDGRGSASGARPGSTSTPCASTSKESRFVAFTGRQARVEGSSW